MAQFLTLISTADSGYQNIYNFVLRKYNIIPGKDAR
jgi:hypothetical protein